MVSQQRGDEVLAEFVGDTWLPHVRMNKSSWKLEESIARNYILPVFGAKALSDISEADVQRWLDNFVKAGCAAATRNRRLHVLKSIFNLAAQTGRFCESPTDQLHSTRVKRTSWPALDGKRMGKLLTALNESQRREARAIALLLHTGARKSEILNARWENLFLEAGLLLTYRAEGGPGRKVWLSAEAKKILRSIPRQEGSPWIFPGRDSTRPISDVFLFWKELRSELGLGDLSIRDLRYVFAEWQLRSGISPVAIQSCLGISDMRHVNRQLVHSGTGETRV